MQKLTEVHGALRGKSLQGRSLHEAAVSKSRDRKGQLSAVPAAGQIFEVLALLPGLPSQAEPASP